MKVRVNALSLLLLVVAIGCAPAPSVTALPVPTPVVVIPSGLVSRMTASEVADFVLSEIHKAEAVVGHALKPARIVSISASGGPEAGVVWDVNAEGTFITNRTPPGASGMPAGSIGFYRISDADGGILDFGFL
jgi:hypothetical protein